MQQVDSEALARIVREERTEHYFQRMQVIRIDGDEDIHRSQ
jgi:hypothetical protein